MKYMKQFCLIIGISFLGELLKDRIPVPVPASIYGLVLLFVLLCTGIVKLEQVEGAADFLVNIMPLMFIPAGVGLMKEWKVLSELWLSFVVILVLTTVLVMVVTGRVTQCLIRNHDPQSVGKEERL